MEFAVPRTASVLWILGLLAVQVVDLNAERTQVGVNAVATAALLTQDETKTFFI